MIIPEVSITLDKERKLKFTIGAVLRFKQATGKDLRDPEVNARLAKDIDLDDLVALLWACLYKDDKTLTVEAVSDMVDFSNLTYAIERLSEAMTVAKPEAGESPLASRPNG